jgi:hypothetical protein
VIFIQERCGEAFVRLLSASDAEAFGLVDAEGGVSAGAQAPVDVPGVVVDFVADHSHDVGDR